jgi:hypothetical protein
VYLLGTQKTIAMYKLTFAVAALAVTLPFVSFSQNNDDMKAMMAAATPGESHQMLAKSAGSWTGTVTMWMQPGAPPTVSQAQATNEMIMGGRYLKSTNSGNVMGMPFEGVGITGYDNVRKQFVNSWIDNMGTGIMTMSGAWDAASKSIVYTGSMADPVSGKDMAFREVWKFVDNDHQVMEMYNQIDGKEVKSMEISYTRK